jgi:hypothetical protein
MAKIVLEVVSECRIGPSPGHEGVAAGRTDRVLVVVVAEQEPTRSEAVEIRGVHLHAAADGDVVAPKLWAKVVHHDH